MHRTFSYDFIFKNYSASFSSDTLSTTSKNLVPVGGTLPPCPRRRTFFRWPARTRRLRYEYLTVVFCPPALDKGHPLYDRHALKVPVLPVGGILPPIPWQRTSGWCTSWSTRKLPRTRGSPTGSTASQTPVKHKLKYILKLRSGS